MTTVQFSTIAQSIANISLTAKSIRTMDASNIPVDGLMYCPYFAPRPRDFITDIQFSREAFGTGGAEPMNLIYTMNWEYFHAPIGQVLTFQKYSELLDNLAYLIQQIANSDAVTGAVDMTILNITSIAGIQDPAGNTYHGVELALRVTEFIK